MKYILFYFDPHLTSMFSAKTGPDGKKIEALTGHHNFTSAGDLAAQAVEAASPAEAAGMANPIYAFHFLSPWRAIKTGPGILYDSTALTWTAKETGFLVMDRTEGLHLVSLFQATHRRQKGWYYIHPSNSGRLPVYEDIEKVLTARKVTAPMPADNLRAALLHIDPKSEHLTHLLVAKAPQEAVNPRPEYFEPLVDLSPKKAVATADGQIDFHQQSAVIPVKAGMPVLRRHPEVQAVEGIDIFGKAVAPVAEKANGLRPGENLVPSETEEEVMVSAIDGCLVADKTTVSAKPVLNIQGDVDFSTGNIDFNGSVIIEGRIHADFKVKAAGDVIVKQDIEDAAVEAGGNVTVVMGISGRGSAFVKAEGNVNAKFILNSRVEARGKVIVEGEIMGSRVFSDDRVLVLGKPGRIIGGEVSALRSVEAVSAGTRQETPTLLSSGRSLDIEREMEDIRVRFSAAKEALDDAVNHIVNTFGPHFLENPKAHLLNMTGEKQQICIAMLQEESVAQKRLSDVKAEFLDAEARSIPKEQPFVIVKDKVFPGCKITIGKAVYNTEEVTQNARYFLSPETGKIETGSGH